MSDPVRLCLESKITSGRSTLSLTEPIMTDQCSNHWHCQVLVGLFACSRCGWPWMRFENPRVTSDVARGYGFSSPLTRTLHYLFHFSFRDYFQYERLERDSKICSKEYEGLWFGETITGRKDNGRSTSPCGRVQQEMWTSFRSTAGYYHYSLQYYLLYRIWNQVSLSYK